MPTFSATAQSCPNIAFIKYWGNKDHLLRIPSNSSISMNLGGLETRTTVTFDKSLKADQLILNGKAATEEARLRASRFLDHIRTLANASLYAHIESSNNFPAGAGIASSSSAFAALSLAATSALGLLLDEPDLSRLARLGSGSACRSIPAGFVEWQAGNTHEESYAQSIAAPEHWQLADCIAIVSEIHKEVGSSSGHGLAQTSPLQNARLENVKQRVVQCKQAILTRDFQALAEVAEFDCNLMHAVIMTTMPPVIYWSPATLAVIAAIKEWRAAGLEVFYTIDAGPNVHVICPSQINAQVQRMLVEVPGVQHILTALPGGPARTIE